MVEIRTRTQQLTIARQHSKNGWCPTPFSFPAKTMRRILALVAAAATLQGTLGFVPAPVVSSRTAARMRPGVVRYVCAVSMVDEMQKGGSIKPT